MSQHEHRGPLIAIGGAEDKVGARAVLREFVSRAGGDRAVVAVFPTASMIPGELAVTYGEIFRDLGAEVRIVRVETRADGEDPAVLAELRGVTAIFFTGGAQGRIVTMLGGTPLAQAIRRAYRAGVVVAGTSAGASVVCDHMIAQGKSGYAPRRQSVTLAPGLGLTKRLVIDQHFAQRHRIGRLFSAVAMNPFLIGVGIDEDTAIVLDAQNRIEVLGRGTVTVVDGARIAHTDIPPPPPGGPGARRGRRAPGPPAGAPAAGPARPPGGPPAPLPSAIPAAPALGASGESAGAEAPPPAPIPIERPERSAGRSIPRGFGGEAPIVIGRRPPAK